MMKKPFKKSLNMLHQQVLIPSIDPYLKDKNLTDKDITYFLSFIK